MQFLHTFKEPRIYFHFCSASPLAVSIYLSYLSNYLCLLSKFLFLKSKLLPINWKCLPFQALCSACLLPDFFVVNQSSFILTPSSFLKIVSSFVLFPTIIWLVTNNGFRGLGYSPCHSLVEGGAPYKVPPQYVWPWILNRHSHTTQANRQSLIFIKTIYSATCMFFPSMVSECLLVYLLIYIYLSICPCYKLIHNRGLTYKGIIMW